VILPSPCALSFSKYPSIYECSLIFTFLYPDNFLMWPLMLLMLEFSRLFILSRMFYLSSYSVVVRLLRIDEFYWVKLFIKDFSLSEAFVDFSWVIIGFSCDLWRKEGFVFVLLSVSADVGFFINAFISLSSNDCYWLVLLTDLICADTWWALWMLDLAMFLSVLFMV